MAVNNGNVVAGIRCL